MAYNPASRHHQECLIHTFFEIETLPSLNVVLPLSKENSIMDPDLLSQTIGLDTFSIAPPH